MILDCCREEKVSEIEEEVSSASNSNEYVFIYMCCDGWTIRDSNVGVAAFAHLLQYQQPCSIGDFLNRFKMMLRHASFGLLELQWAELPDHVSLMRMLDGCKEQSERGDVQILEEAQWRALLDTFALCGSLAHVVEEEIGLPQQQRGQTFSDMIPQLQRIGALFLEKRHLFRNNWEKELEAAILAEESLDKVADWIGKLKMSDGASACVTEGSFESSGISRIPDEIRRVLVTALKNLRRDSHYQGDHGLHAQPVKMIVEKFASHFKDFQLPAAGRIDPIELEMSKEDSVTKASLLNRFSLC